MERLNEREKTRQRLLSHCRVYPKLQVQDVLKFLHQSAFGCEHMGSSSEQAAERIAEEFEQTLRCGPEVVEPLDGAYSRVSLAYMGQGLGTVTFGRLFAASAKVEADGQARLTEKLKWAGELVREGLLPFAPEGFDAAAAAWVQKGCPAVRHSEAFREHYRPAYRVIANRYIPFLPLLAELDRRLETGPVTVAIEGGSASGKTTLSAMLEELYPCTVFHMDDFFLRPEQRTAERYAQAGGNIDWERFLAEVLQPLRKGGAVEYGVFDCGSMSVTERRRIVPERLVVVEGAYSMHPELAGHYDLSVFLDVTPELQHARILHRNSPELAQQFFQRWIPLERQYFTATRVGERCDLTIHIS